MRLLPALALAGLVLASGCVGPLGRGPAECAPPSRGDVLHPSVWPRSFNAGEPSDLVYLAQMRVGEALLGINVTDGNETFSQPAPTYGDGAPVAFEDLRFTNVTGDRHFGAVRLQPDVADAGIVLNFRFQERDPSCSAQGGLTINWGANEVAGDAAGSGQGAHVWYAGFWENGTMFDTNMQGLDAGSGWPKAGWYQGGHWEPIPVYVYDQDRSEQPAHWKSSAGNVPGRPPEADPLDPFVDPALATTTGTVDGTAGLGYFTTIKGFNEAVKGLPVGSRQVFHLAPEDAYTLPGREDHLLYGDALVFYVEVRDVVDAPCPSPSVGVCTNVADGLPAWFA